MSKATPRSGTRSEYEIGGRLLDYCARRISYIHFGDEAVIPSSLEFFRDMMSEAIAFADVSGAPDISGVVRAFDVPEAQKDVRAIVGNRVASMSVFKRNTQRYVSAWFSRDLLPHYGSILRGEEKVTLISVYDELPAMMERAFGIGRVDHIPVPIQAVFVATKERKNTLHYPVEINRIIGEIRPEYKGQIFIVAAGLLAKRYCTEIKRRGGIAIDIGRIAEVWLGKQARGMAEYFINKWKLV